MKNIFKEKYESQNEELRTLANELLEKNILITQNEKKYRNLFDFSPSPMLVHSEEKIVLINDAAIEYFEIPEKKTGIGMSILNFVHKDSKKNIKKRITKINKEQTKTKAKEFKLVTFNNKIKYAETSGFPLKINNKQAIHVVFNDTTEKRITANALIESESKLKSILNTSPIAITTSDLQGNITYVSQQTLNLHAYKTKEELLGTNSLLLIAPEEREFAIKNLEKTLKGEKLINVQYKLIKKDGTTFYAELNASVVRDENGNPKSFVATTNDITERLKTEKALAESEQRFKTLYENIPGGMLIVSKDYEIKDVNSRTCEITGYSKDELIGQLCDIVCQKGSKSKDCPIIERKQESIQGMDTELKCSNGGKNPIIKNAKTIFVDGEEYILENFQDIRGLKHAERVLARKNAELINAKEKAEESNRLKTAFLANMSHEIRTPMNGIVGFVDLLNEANLSDSKRNEYVKIIKESSSQLLNVVNDIIDISKIEVGEIETKITDTNINNILTELFTLYKSIAINKNINLYSPKKLDDNINIVLTDKIKLYQILNNLLNNAIKFTHKGYIKFGCEYKNKNLQFFIEDSGIGIEKKFHKTIFERFGQAKTNSDRLYRGTGLGLSIAKAYTEKLGGEIWFKSEITKGTTFSFTIPYSIGKENFVQNIKKEIYSSQEKELNILIVEDEKINYLILSKMLTYISAITVNAETGKDAIKICNSNENFDIILLDIKLPDTNGYELVKKLKSIRKNTPIIAQTAYAMSGDKQKALNAGFDDYLPKPILKEKLFAMIKKYSK